MPGTKKKPSANERKKVPASARARISTRKVRKVVNADLNESYTQPQTVSREAPHNEITPATTLPSSTAVVSSVTSSDPVLSLLQQLTESNQALLQRVKHIEQNTSHTGFRQRSHLLEHNTQCSPAVQQNPGTSTSDMGQTDGRGKLQPTPLNTMRNPRAHNFASPGSTNPLTLIFNHIRAISLQIRG